MDFEDIIESQVIPFEVAEEVARKLRERLIQDHIRDFGGITVVCFRPTGEQAC